MMRIVGLVALLVVLPMLWSMLSSGRLRRDHAFGLIGLSVFAGGFLPTDVALVSWPLWPAPDRGIIIGLPDCIALALIGTRTARARSIPFKWIFGLHAAVIALSVVMSKVPMASAFSLFQFGRVFLLYIAVAGEIDDPRKLAYLFYGLAIGLVAEAGMVAWQKAQGVVQAPGTASHQNVLAVMVELILLPLLALVMEGGRRQKLLWVGMGSALIVLAGGGSRAGLGLASAGIVLVLILSASHSLTKAKTRVLAGALLVVALAVPVALTTLSERFGSNSVITTEGQRDALEKAARAIASDYPFGVGAGMFVTTSNTGGYSSKAGVAWGGSTRAAPVHNAYLLERAELGLLGPLTFGILLVVPLIAGLRGTFRRPRDAQGGVALGAVGALSAVLVHSLFEYAPVTYDCMSLIGLNIAVIAGFLRARARAAASRQAARRRIEPARQPVEAA